MPGFGTDYARKLSDKFSAKVRYHNFKIEDYEVSEYEISGNTVDATFSGESNIIDVLIEYLSLKNSSFKLVQGIGMINKMNLNILLE